MKTKCRSSASAGCAETGTKLQRSTTYHIRIPFYKRLLSYIYPVPLRSGAGDVNAHLEIFLHHNRLQLVTADAIYSDGDHYIPAVTVVNNLKAILSSVSNVLVLGGGLGSMVQVMRSKAMIHTSPSWKKIKWYYAGQWNFLKKQTFLRSLPNAAMHRLSWHVIQQSMTLYSLMCLMAG